jgi:hypothetical protein
MTVVRPEILSAEEAKCRYDQLCRQINDVEEFRARGEAYELDAGECALYDSLLELEYLLGE